MQLLEAAHILWLLAHHSGLYCHCFTFPDSSSCLPLIKTIVFTRIIRENLPIPENFNLITSVGSLLPHKVTHSQVPGFSTWTSLGEHYSDSYNYKQSTHPFLFLPLVFLLFSLLLYCLLVWNPTSIPQIFCFYLYTTSFKT